MVKRLAAIGVAVGAAIAVAVPTMAATPSVHAQKVGISFLRGDRIVEGNVALAAGVPVRLTITNYTDTFHTFTVPAFGISEIVRPAHGTTPTETTFTFTPKQWGIFSWHCAICPSGIHGKHHAMDGKLYVIVNPSALP